MPAWAGEAEAEADFLEGFARLFVCLDFTPRRSSSSGMVRTMGRMVASSDTPAQMGTQKCGLPSPSVSFGDIISNFAETLKAATNKQLDALKTLGDASCHSVKMGAGVGFEPTTFRL